MTSKTPERHSRMVGGSTAKRFMNCPGYHLASKDWPEQKSSKYADEGTLLHNVMAKLMSDPDIKPESLIGMEEYNGIVLNDDHIDDRILPALQSLDEIDPECEMEITVETEVGFGSLLPGVFGTCDILGKLPDRAVVLDWKFGKGVTVDAEENHQLLFYAAAAMRTETTAKLFEHSEVVELVIVQPPMVRRWQTTKERVLQFEADLLAAVKAAKKKNAPLVPGEWCKWCPGQDVNGDGEPYCLKMRRPVEKFTTGDVQVLDNELIEKVGGGQMFKYSGENLGRALKQWREIIEPIGSFIEKKITEVLEAGGTVPGWKLVPKRATRQWVDEQATLNELKKIGVPDDVMYKPDEVLSPAQMEKALKKLKLQMPEGLVVSVSSGTTLAPDTDKRIAVGNASQELAEALGEAEQIINQ